MGGGCAPVYIYLVNMKDPIFNWLVKLDTGLLIAILGLGLTFYQQWQKEQEIKKLETKEQLKEAKQSSRERGEIFKTLKFMEEKLNFVLEWISGNSKFK